MNKRDLNEREKKEARRTAEFLKSAPTHFKYWNDKQRQHAENEAAEFRAAFAERKCSVCGQPIASYTKSEPCLHWLLRPDGFEKEDLPRIANREAMGHGANAAFPPPRGERGRLRQKH
jgi:hypothetical protein